MPNRTLLTGMRPTLSRRRLLEMTGLGFGSLALAGLVESESLRAATPVYNDLEPRKGHFPARAEGRHSVLPERRAEPDGSV